MVYLTHEIDNQYQLNNSLYSQQHNFLLPLKVVGTPKRKLY